VDMFCTTTSFQDSLRVGSGKDADTFAAFPWWMAEDLFSLFNEGVAFHAETDEKNYLHR